MISKKDGSRYIGITQDLKRRIDEHNNGGAKYSSSKRPYKLIWYSVFASKEKAYKFERYLKVGSGHAFVGKHII